MAGKHILLVGASGAIGSQLAVMFPQDQLFLHYHRNEPAGKGHRVQADITRYEEVDQMVTGLLTDFGHIDVVINATGVSTDGFTHKFDPAAWSSVIDTNLVGSFNLARAVLPSMRKNRYGRMIMLSSVVYQRPVLGTSAYSASKAGLIGLTRSIAIENSSLGITCNCVALGYFDMGLYQIPESLREEIREAIPMKRFGRVDELFGVLQCLINTEYLTGQVIALNGGLFMG